MAGADRRVANQIRAQPRGRTRNTPAHYRRVSAVDAGVRGATPHEFVGHGSAFARQDGSTEADRVVTKQELTASEVANIVARTCPVENYRGKKVLLIVPDATRTAPVGLLFKTIHAQSAGA